jgi:outer membrane protein TolC
MRRIVPLAWILVICPLAALAQDQSPPEILGKEGLLSLYEAEGLALENNRGLVIARSIPQVAASLEDQAEGVFDPLGFAEFGFAHSEDPLVSPVQNAFGAAGGGVIALRKIEDDVWQGGTGLSGILPFGLQYSSTYTYTRFDTNSAFSGLERDYRPVWESVATLPLLRDFIHNEANVIVKQSRIQRELSEEEFRQSIIDLLVGVDSAYWRLAALRATEGVASKSLEVANDIVEQTRVQYEVGVVSRVNVSQAAAGQAEREFDFIVAQAAAANAQDFLIDLIEHPDLAALRSTKVVTEDPAFVEYSVDEEVAVEKAMRLRPELAQDRRRLEDAELQLAFARNQRLPRLDVVGGYTLTGLAGPGREIASADPNLAFPGGKVDGVPLHGRSAHNNWFGASGAHSWNIGGRVEIPLGNHTARARVVQRDIELRRARTELRRQEQEIVLEVRNAARDLRAAIQGLQAAERRRAAQAESLRAEQERLRLGDSTPREVLEQQRDLAEAERQVISALQVYRDSITALEQSQGTLLQTRGIRFEQELNR